MIVGALFLVALNAFFVAAEFGLVAARRARIDQLVVEGSARAAAAQRAMRELNLPLPGPLDVIATHGTASVIAFALITFLHVVLGELVPKNLAIAAPERVALWVAIPIRGFTRLFQPLIWLFNEGANRVVRLLGVEPQSELRSVHTLEEIRLLLEESRRAGAIELPHANIFERTFEFPDKRVHDATVPRSDVHAVATDHDVSEVLDLARRSRQGRDARTAGRAGIATSGRLAPADERSPHPLRHRRRRVRVDQWDHHPRRRARRARWRDRRRAPRSFRDRPAAGERHLPRCRTDPNRGTAPSHRMLAPRRRLRDARRLHQPAARPHRAKWRHHRLRRLAHARRQRAETQDPHGGRRPPSSSCQPCLKEPATTEGTGRQSYSEEFCLPVPSVVAGS